MLLLALAACGADDSTAETTFATEVTEAATEASTIEPTDGVAEEGAQQPDSAPSTSTAEVSDTPALGSAANGQIADVVLVEFDDVLNYRFGPGVDFEIAGSFGPTATGLALTDVTDVVGGSPWVFIDGAGWSNAFFLTSPLSDAEFAANQDAQDLVYQLEDIFANGGDLSEVTSWRGLFLSQPGEVIRYRSADVPNLLTDASPLYWGYCQEGECTAGSFADQVGGGYVDAIGDEDTQVLTNTLIPGPNGAQEDFIIPTEFQNFNYVAIHDPGDDPEFGGLDWMTWYVFIEATSDGPQVVALLLDQWLP